MNWDSILTQRQAKYPTENFVRFVARNYYDAPDRAAVRFLDIGSGRHAPNTRFLEDAGFFVLAVDPSLNALAHLHCRFEELLITETGKFDCIVDHNTFCHIEKPPIAKVRAALKDGGKFFSVCPTSETWRGHLKGKGFCRCATKKDIAKLYVDFSNIKVGRACYPDDCHTVSSWVIEATK